MLHLILTMSHDTDPISDGILSTFGMRDYCNTLQALHDEALDVIQMIRVVRRKALAYSSCWRGNRFMGLSWSLLPSATHAESC